MVRSKKLYASEVLADRLKLLHGSEMGYIPWATTMLGSMPGGRKVSSSMVAQIVYAQKPAPLWMVVAFARLITEDLTLDRDAAYAYAVEHLFDFEEAGDE